MNTIELRNRDEARVFLLQGVLLSRLTPATPAMLPAILASTQELAGSQPLPPPGFLVDLGHVLFGAAPVNESLHEPSEEWPAPLLRTYEDYVLGKLYADSTVERAGEVLRRYQGRDRDRGLAFVVEQLRQRCGFDVVLVSPALLKGLQREQGETLLKEAWHSVTADGVSPVLTTLYESLISSFRHSSQLLGPEDLFELDHGTALQELGQRVALRQVLTATEALLADIPRQPFRPRGREQFVATHFQDEDAYPVGGYSSLTTRGTVESLLYSQLAYMEKVERPDLFDIKYLRDELLYYARDENSFLRRRRSFVFALFPDLRKARFKDDGLPWQRIILVLALVVAPVRQLTGWLCQEALIFDICFIESEVPSPLADEYRLLELLLREPIVLGTVRLTRAANAAEVTMKCTEFARQSKCHCLTVSTVDQVLQADETVQSRLIVDHKPELRGIDGYHEEEKSFIAWQRELTTLLSHWC